MRWIPRRKSACVLRDQPPRALLHLLNVLPTIAISLVCFLPVSTYCFLHLRWWQLAALIAASLLVYALPQARLACLQLSSTRAAYRRLGVHLLNHVVQHGTLVARSLRLLYPAYRRVRSRADASKLRLSTYNAERFHWALLIFFLLCSADAALHRRLGWLLLILLTNVLYNLYPIWLQQYLRLRLDRCAGRATSSDTATLGVTQ